MLFVILENGGRYSCKTQNKYLLNVLIENPFRRLDVNENIAF